MGRLGRVSAAFALLALAGCTISSGIGDSFIAFNEGVARASRQVVLLNVVRASQRQSIIYTRFSGLHGQVTGQFNNSMPISVGPGASEIHTLTSALNLSGTPSFDMAVLDDQTFTQAVMTSVDDKMIAFFQEQNWPMDILLHLTVEEIRTSEKLKKAVVDASDLVCAGGDYVKRFPYAWSDDTKERCEFLLHLLAVRSTVCAMANQTSAGDRDPFYKRAVPVRKDGISLVLELVYDNKPQDPCLFNGFQEYLTRLLILQIQTASAEQRKILAPQFNAAKGLAFNGPLIDALTKANDGGYTVQNTDGKWLLGTKSSDIKFVLLLPSASASRSEKLPLADFGRTVKELSFKSLSVGDAKADKDSPQDLNATTLSLRSPNSILYYLGEVVRSKYPRAEDGDWTQAKSPVSVRYHNGQLVKLFDVSVDSGSDRDLQVKLQGHRFYTPQETDNRADQVIAFVDELLRLYQKSEKPPTTQSVQIIGGS